MRSIFPRDGRSFSTRELADEVQLELSGIAVARLHASARFWTSLYVSMPGPKQPPREQRGRALARLAPIVAFAAVCASLYVINFGAVAPSRKESAAASHATHSDGESAHGSHARGRGLSAAAGTAALAPCVIDPLATGEFQCGYLVTVSPLSRHILEHRPRRVGTPRLVEEYKSASLVRYSSQIKRDGKATELAELARRIDAHFTKLVRPLNAIRDHVSVGVYDERSPASIYHRFYNIFSLDEPAVGALYWSIKRAFHDYRERNGLPRQRYLIHGWLTCFRWRDLARYMPFHSHATTDPAKRVVSGEASFDASPCAQTEFVERLGPDDKFPDVGPHRDPGEPGNRRRRVQYMGDADSVILFDGSAPHRVGTEGNFEIECMKWWDDRTPKDLCRAGVAFDIASVQMSPQLHHSVLLYDPDDEWWERADEQAQRAESINQQIASQQRAMGLGGRLDTVETLLRDATALQRKQRAK